MQYTPGQIGELVRETRKKMGVTQKELALTSGTGIRFIIDLERGKKTAEIGKVLTILNTLGIQMTLTPPSVAVREGSPWPAQSFWTARPDPRRTSARRIRTPLMD